jgi:hypothetical protein
VGGSRACNTQHIKCPPASWPLDSAGQADGVTLICTVLALLWCGTATTQRVQPIIGTDARETGRSVPVQ